MKEIQHKHLPPQIFNLKAWVVLVDESQLQKIFSDILSRAGFNVLDYSSHQFPVNGFSAFWLLAESHLAIHTFTNSGWCYVELSSCNKEKAFRFKELVKEALVKVTWDDEIKCSEPNTQYS
ncbi:S-adenosylmethionine decarboxylase [Saccharicrinis fermentans]|uniref:S-adenosylmethionine decarboxylase proenzyme n=1 Tax=Saccharicrinis fermentans DSM 9555 = JCM 21142 TaxID=869213 RepID=W7Y1P2_9BACT|nr:S-adenosylmethionine decarboxylase [Saccharicrinis fermentans]GAF01428.1 S-adenosylmethionine decarboxylase proenzyme precursor [Saccharicrinis fermentans DSM 9555 = JCM 21142]